ncbi:MAG: anthranilate synthase component I family protein [Bacteroidales bacterium]|nr:anthranilate synthase component I family protein [Bacteroidales bacterium]
MRNFKINTITKKILADTITPVSIYLKARDLYSNSILLESSDYHGNENSYSFICLQPMAWFKVSDFKVEEQYPGQLKQESIIDTPDDFRQKFTNFINSFKLDQKDTNLPYNGLFGYSAYNAVQYFEKIKLNARVNENYRIPDIIYSFYKYVIAVNHFKNDLIIIENQLEHEKSEIDKIESLIYNRNVPTFNFVSDDHEVASLTDKEYKNMVSQGKKHCYRGDVFQIVLSRQYSQKFIGDEFNVYRALRSINPSPYLFYFDYGSFKIFGSSPEAQLKIENGKAYINPIAGTFKRTGDDEKDKQLARELSTDIKENAEHVMLVDLARNDLSRHATDVKVESYREIQFYSHVLHMVSTVSGKLEKDANSVDLMMATFPAGTLSGAPKYKAMELIDTYENQSRGYYGGAIGLLGFEGNFNHAIMIRTFLSKNNTLFYQAGAGIVSVSKEESELQEVNNKLGALKKAINMAKEI